MPFSSDDQIPRLEKFKSEHPELVVVPPDRASRFWEAIDENGAVVADAYWLEWLLDKLEQLTAQ